MSSNTSQSQRLPSFRDYGDIQKVVLPFPRNKILAKKTYVPNLDVSRKTTPGKDKNDSPKEEVFVKKEESHHSRHGRHDRRQTNFIQTESVFSTGVGKTNATSAKSTAKSTPSTSSAGKSKKLKSVVEKLDKQRKTNREKGVFREALEKETKKLEKQPTVSTHNLPVTIPRNQPSQKATSSDSKINSLLTDIVKPNDEMSPLFLLKTPKYIPLVLDGPQNPKTSTVKQENTDKNSRMGTIHDLPEGQIGRLQIMKSGKLRLVLGDCKFLLQRGVKVNFKEELAVIRTNNERKTAEIVNLGSIQDRIVVVPENITNLIKNS